MFTRRRLRTGCLSLVAMLVMGYLAALVYSKNAGRWASSNVISIPAESEFITEVEYEEDGYHNLLRLYTMPTSIQDVRNWYLKNWYDSIGWSMSPVDESTQEDITHYNLVYGGIDHWEYELLYITAVLTLNPNYKLRLPDCFDAVVYRSIDLVDYPAFEEHLSGIEVPKDRTVLLVNTCWPDF